MATTPGRFRRCWDRAVAAVSETARRRAMGLLLLAEFLLLLLLANAGEVERDRLLPSGGISLVEWLRRAAIRPEEGIGGLRLPQRPPGPGLARPRLLLPPDDASEFMEWELAARDMPASSGAELPSSGSLNSTASTSSEWLGMTTSRPSPSYSS